MQLNQLLKLKGGLCRAGQLLHRDGFLRNNNPARCMCSSGGSLVKVTVDDKTGVATVALNRPPVNSLSLELLTELHLALEKMDTASTGIILASTIKKVFCAGLDLTEVYQPSRDRLSAFWHSFQECYVKLYGSSRPVIAAINGHAPAAGCILALACDYRIMADGNPKLGANEVHLGILAPFWFQDMLISTVGKRQASLLCQTGELIRSQEAYKIGLVDKLVAEEDVMSAAQEEMKRWTSMPDFARHLTKIRMNRNNFDYFLARREEDVKWQVDYFLQPKVQKILGSYIESLKTKKKA